MRRAGGNFEIIIKSPTLGLMTRVPGDQPDARYATAASNVRFDDGVIRNAPGAAAFITTPVLDSPANLIFQCTVSPGAGGDKLSAVIICTGQKIYSVRNLVESSFALNQNQAIEFRGELKSHDDIRRLATAQRTGGYLGNNWILAVSINDNLELWKFRHRLNTEIDDDNAYLVPFDYGAETNNNIFVRIG